MFLPLGVVTGDIAMTDHGQVGEIFSGAQVSAFTFDTRLLPARCRVGLRNIPVVLLGIPSVYLAGLYPG